MASPTFGLPTGRASKRTISPSLAALGSLGAGDSFGAIADEDPSKLAAPYGSADPYGGAPNTLHSPEFAKSLQSTYDGFTPAMWQVQADEQSDQGEMEREQKSAALEGLRALTRGYQQKDNPDFAAEQALRQGRIANRLGGEAIDTKAAASMGQSATALRGREMDDAIAKAHEQFVRPAEINSDERARAAEFTANARVQAADARRDGDIAAANAKAGKSEQAAMTIVKALIDRGKTDPKTGKPIPFSADEANALYRQYGLANGAGGQQFPQNIENALLELTQHGMTRESAIAAMRAKGYIQ